ncbi:MAG: hypothetical protein FWB93_03795 [Oscillospiraceae bacterium]|nr:hypothetical protein [Oscillospiraceae bacterium]
MKKFITLALVLTMLLLTLVACNNGNDPQPQNDVNQQTRVQLPEWPENLNTIEIPEDAMFNTVNAIPSLADDIEHFNRSLQSEWSQAKVFRGIVIDEQPIWMQIPWGDEYMDILFTDTKFLIQEVFFGSFGDLTPGEAITIRQRGGVYNGVQVWVSSSNLLVDLPIGEEFIVFTMWDDFTESYFPVHHHQAFHWLGNPYGGRALSATADTSIMEAGYVEIVPSPQNVESWMETLVITREFLAEIAEAGGHEIGAPIPADVMERVQVVHEQVAAARAEREAEAMREQQVAE